MQRAEIFVGAGIVEREGKAVVGVERLGFEQASGRGDRVGNVVCVPPSDVGARLHRERRRSEGEMVDLDRRVLGASESNAEDGCGDQDRGAEEAAPPTTNNVHDVTGPKFQPCSGLSLMASRCWPRTKLMSLIPSSQRHLSSATFIRPAECAAPGAGFRRAVDIAVWKATLPSTFCIT